MIWRFSPRGDFLRRNPRLRLTPTWLFSALTLLTVCLSASGPEHHAFAEESLPWNGSIGTASSKITASLASYFDFTTTERGREEWLPDSLFQNESIHQHHPVEIPEPLLFDLVRPLGARKGELEFNTLAIFPWRASNRNTADDPFGSSPTTFDKGGIEWAPEVEYAFADNLAVEFEFPFESSTLEEYKLGLQWTIGTALDNHYIHGVQALVQPTTEWEHWSSTLLYLGGLRFDETWSTLFMVGGRMDLEGAGNSSTLEGLINASLFADITDSARLGLESNYAVKRDGTAEFILSPQVHYQFTKNLQVQSGLGFGSFSEGSEHSFILRVIFSN